MSPDYLRQATAAGLAPGSDVFSMHAASATPSMGIPFSNDGKLIAVFFSSPWENKIRQRKVARRPKFLADVVVLRECILLTGYLSQKLKLVIVF
jgi:hypothetical protein